MSQFQRYGSHYDGVVAGAPAFRFAQQQTNHLLSVVAEHTMDYYPCPCEMSQIVSSVIDACDSLDGRTDGVVARTDLCMFNFDLTSIIGIFYSCAAENNTSLGFGFSSKNKQAQTSGSTRSYKPAQNGTISADAVALAQRLYSGLFNTAGERVYLPWQAASAFEDATTSYDSTSGEWELGIPSTGGKYITSYVQLIQADNLSDLNNVTYDTLQEWMQTGYLRYLDSL